MPRQISGPKASCIFLCFLLLISILSAGHGYGQPSDPSSSQNPEAPVDRFSALLDSVTAAIEMGQQSIEGLKNQKADLKTFIKALTLEISQFNIQSASIGNRIQAPDVQIDTLKKARQDHQDALNNLEQRHKQLLVETEQDSRLRSETEAQISLSEKQLADIKQADIPPSDKRPILSKIGELIQVLKAKQELLIDIQETFTEKDLQLTENINDGYKLLQNIDNKSEEVRKKTLFQRQENLLKMVKPEMVMTEVKHLLNLPFKLSQSDFWSSQILLIWQVGGFLTVTYMILLLAWVWLLIRLHSRIKCPFLDPAAGASKWLTLANRMVCRNTVWIGMTGVFYLILQTGGLKVWPEFIQFVTHTLVVMLFSKWILLFIRRIRHPIFSSPEVLPTLVFLVRWVRMLSILSFAMEWVLGSASVLLLAIRFVFEMSLLCWTVVFSRRVRKTMAMEGVAKSLDGPLAVACAYLISGGGLVAEMAGFGSFAVYWFMSWLLSAVVLVWAKITYHVITEWDQPLGATSLEAKASGKEHQPFHLIRWLGFRISWMSWGILMCLLLLLVWGDKNTILGQIQRVLTYKLEIGNIAFSLMNIVNAMLILFFTHFTAMLWEHILKHRMLDNSGIEMGLKDSILKINHYVVWAIGVLIAVHAFGLNSGTLAVAFGAVGVGLGFGLQTIFNNFVSGIILLFERPIQVGDAVEINGIWGEVQKINFRSTVVQTFDNASMIIPNSEFVSSSVVNWTFKDKRLRRKISIGVAYGSDVELVRKTLLEIASQTDHILRYPPPDVVFYEHGESTLNFWLRYWTHVDTIFKTETDVRFQIDKLFKERNISIAFPRRDVHVFMEKSPEPDAAADSLEDMVQSVVKSPEER
jgi:potassium-dependent mechanosensitive channel